MAGEHVTYDFALLDKRLHVREAFSCGEESLDKYIKRQAAQDMKAHAAVVHVLTAAGEPNTIIGYYTLSSTAVLLGDVPAETAKRLRRYPLVSATLLGRLAVDVRFKGEGHGARLLRHALRQSLATSTEIASAMVVVDALHERASAFYERYGFLPLTDSPLRLYLHMDTIRNSLNAGE